MQGTKFQFKMIEHSKMNKNNAKSVVFVAGNYHHGEQKSSASSHRRGEVSVKPFALIIQSDGHISSDDYVHLNRKLAGEPKRVRDASSVVYSIGTAPVDR